MKNYLLFIFILGFVIVSLAKVNAQTVFINEIHYDNASTDAGEAVEIAGPAGTDLTGWSLVLYNGSNGAAYGTTNLSGSIPNSSNGYGFIILNYPSNGIQNGAPDGIALVDVSNNVIQFISYEGTMTAAGGPADGMLSTEIGVSESGSGAVGNSLQLSGTGTVYTDFTWQAEAANTFSAINTGQVFLGGSLNVVINEFSVSTTGTDYEYIELKSTANTDLSEYTLLEIEGDAGLTVGVIDEVIGLGTTDSDGYLLVNVAANTFENGTLSLLLVKNFTGALTDDLDTDDDGVFDVSPWDEITDDVAINDGGASDITYSTSVLSVAYDGLSYAPGGASRIPDGIDTDLSSDWMRNDFDLYGINGYVGTPINGEAINTPGTVNEKYVLIENISLIINEVDADTPGSDTEEFVELYDGGLGNKALDGYVVVLYNGSNDLSYAAYDLDGYLTNAEGYFVLGNSGVANVDLTFANNFLQNGADAVALYKADASDFPSGTAVTTTNLEDALVYGTSDADDAGLLVLLNAGESQIDDNADNSMQRIPNGSGGARNTSTYSTTTPTPGTENGVIVTPPAPELISIAEARVTAEGGTVTITGTLTVSDQFAGAAYMQDATAGIAVFDPQVHGAGLFEIGDSITITGTLTIYNGLLEVSSLSSVIFHGPANSPIQPKVITLAEMNLYPSELVTVEDATFPIPGDLLFGNTNFVLTDVSGTGEMRMDGDVTDLVGLAQPEVCEVTGVLSQYNEIYQLMPRMKSDLPCATEFSTEDGLGISKDLTLDVATWNIEWFGDSGTNSPTDDQIQKDSVKAVLMALDADIIGVEEISDDVLLAQMVSEMPGYDFVLSDACSYPDGDGDKQKIGFIYKTATVAPVSTKVLLASIHPYYNGGDGSALVGYPEDPTHFYASGRMPFMLTADVTIGGVTERISFIDLHARANSADYQVKYDMRKYDVEVLKDTLDAYYADQKIVMVGDYNDDVDETVADVNTTVTTYQAYVDDATHYSFPTRALSDANFRSYAFYPNMIDHVMLSDELFANYIDGSAKVHYEFYDSDYTNTSSDHFPVSVRLQVQTLELVSVSTSGIDCNEGSNGTATVEVSGGIPPYSYLWSDGQTTATADNLSAGTYTVTVTDALLNEVSAEVELTDPDPIELVLSDNKVVYPAYSDSACVMLSVLDVYGGTGNYTYEWSTGETTESIYVCPTEETVYTLTVNDENMCQTTASVTVYTVDLLCTQGNGMDKIQICFDGKSICVALPAVDELLQKGAGLGTCTSEEVLLISLDDFKVYPNPFVKKVMVSFTSNEKTDGTLDIVSSAGVSVYNRNLAIHKGYNKVELNLSSLFAGSYVVVISGSNIAPLTETVIKQ